MLRYPDSMASEEPERGEAEIRAFWRREDIFHRSEREREGRPTFVFYEGPPTANGRPGVHHVISRLIKDVFCRYKTMTGHHVRRKGGWDTHGLPVEIEVERQLGLSSKDDVERYGIEAFNRKCRESVFQYKKEWDEFTERIGFWLDLDDPYITYADDYIESVWWLLQELWRKDLLYKGYKVVPYCTRCETALSSHEVAQGYQDVDDPSVTVRMRAVDADYSFLVWTTTPWTLPSNVALAVGADIDYVLLESEGERFVLAEARVPSLFDLAQVQVLQRMKGRELVGRRYEQLIPVLTVDKPAFFVIATDFVSTTDGTGIVHMAPAYGEDDQRAAREHDLPILHPVDKAGRFGPELTPYAGLHAKAADKQILRDLKSQGRLFRHEQLRHSYPHCWRCKSPLLYYARDSWYIATTRMRDELISANEQVNWVPSGAGKERFGDWLRNNVDWALSRDRFWGTPLPIWECESCASRICIGSRADISEHGGTPPKDLHRPFVDAVVLRCSACGGPMRRTPEVIDVWFDSGAMPYAQWHYPFENRELFEQQFPADFISEGMDQTRGWFYSLLAISTLISGKSSYRNVVAIGLLLDKQGQKMSKSKGNAVDPLSILREDGADALRWYLAINSPISQPTRFDAEGVKEVQRRVFSTLENVYAFFALYANVDSQRARTMPRGLRPSDQLDRWLLSRYHAVVSQVRSALDSWDATVACRVLSDFIVDELSNWYVRRSRRRFWKGEPGAAKSQAYDTLFTVLDGVARLMAPFAPFLAERLYRCLHGEAVDASVHLAEFPQSDEAARDHELEERMAAVLALAALGRSLRMQNELRVRQPLREALVHGRSAAVRDAVTEERFASLLLDELNLKRLRWLDDPGRVAQISAKANFRNLGKRFGKETPRVAAAVAELDGEAISRLRRGEAVQIELDGRTLTLESEDIFVHEAGLPGYVSGSSGECLLALNTELDEELRREGLARELINRIQNLRKQGALHVSDRIELSIRGDAEVAAAVAAHGGHIGEETLAASIAAAELPGALAAELEIDGHAVWLALRRAEGVGSS